MKPFNIRKIILAVICVVVVSVYVYACSQDKRPRLPFGNSDWNSLSYEQAYDMLTEAGFTNIKSVVKTTKDAEEVGTLNNVKVGDSYIFSKGVREDSSTLIELTYYELAQYDITLSMDVDENRGKPIFTIYTNLTDDVTLDVILSNDGGYSAAQTITVRNGKATSKEFLNDEESLYAGEYKLTVTMNIQDQEEGLVLSSAAEMRYGEYGECLTGDYVYTDSNGKYRYVYAEFECELEYPNLEQIYSTLSAEDIEYDALQQFFIDLTEDITPDELVGIAEERGLYIKKYNSDKYDVYQVTLEEINYSIGNYTAGTYYGKKDGTVYMDNVAVSFDMDDGTLEYYLYLKESGYEPDYYSELIYYNHGRYGDYGFILWNEYMTEDVSGFYGPCAINLRDENEGTTLKFRDDEDVSYYYQGDTIHTSYVIYDSAEEMMNVFLLNQETYSEYNQRVDEISAAE